MHLLHVKFHGRLGRDTFLDIRLSFCGEWNFTVQSIECPRRTLVEDVTATV